MEKTNVVEQYIKQSSIPAIQDVEDYNEFIEYLSVRVQNALSSLIPISLDVMLEFCRVAAGEVDGFCAIIEDKVFDIRNSPIHADQGKLFDD